MRIGVTVNFQHSYFSAGSPMTALSVAEMYLIGGHEVTFINTGSPKSWWDDIVLFSANWKRIQQADLSGHMFDFIVEVGSNTLTVKERLCSSSCVWLQRKTALFYDIEASLFPLTEAKRPYEGLSEVWIYDEMSSKDDVDYLKLLTRLPVRTLPFVWTASGIEAYRQETGAKVWQDTCSTKPYTVHICETNISSSSSSIIPLFIVRQISKECPKTIDDIIRIHNAETLQTGDFFKANVLTHVFSDIEEKPVFIGRQRISDYVNDSNSIVIAHSRFISIRPYLFDCVWSGIPLLHNSKLFNKVGGYVSEGYYADNDILGGCEAYKRITGFKPSKEELVSVRKSILENFSPMCKEKRDCWLAALTPLPLPLPLPLPMPVPVAEVITIGFCDMWSEFNPEYNFFTLLLAEATKKVIIGKVADEKVDLIIFGPFGADWKKFPSIPKVHFTGENTDENVSHESIKLNLGFKHFDFENGTYLRLPLWMLEINWFNADVNKLQNPKPISVESCCVAETLCKRDKFCAFIVTNPCQPMRNNAFNWLSEYKKVDSAGRLYNNIGPSIFAGLGGGGGELIKHEFLKGYKFCLAFENNSSKGYTTEKLLHAKAAGCIPIYWGDPNVERDFDMEGIIDARNITTKEELIELVKKVDTDDELYNKMRAVPALSEYKRELVRRTLSECAWRIMKLLGIKEAPPRFIGSIGSPSAPAPSSVKVGILDTVLISAANTRFLPSIQQWIQGMELHMGAQPGLTTIVYFMKDVTESVEASYKEKYPKIIFRRLPETSFPGFEDFWNPQHFAWKLWILKETVNDESLKGRNVLYMDSGSILVRWPTEFLGISKDNGVCVIEDDEQYNRSWCHSAFNTALGVSQQELDSNQIWAGCISFVCGSNQAISLFNEAFKLGCVRDIIVGGKWEGMFNGKPYGHRHDQSILSILSQRQEVPRHPLKMIYCDVSLRHTSLTNKYIYVHRGLFKVHEAFEEGIDDCFVINLDRRRDRLESFYSSNTDMKKRTMRLGAIEGTKIRLTKSLVRLFKPHDFKWKKAVMGCALSHLSLWFRLVCDKPEINSYLIMEDDVRLKQGWREKWREAYSKAPPDWDVIYLGGVLPPNRGGFEQNVEMVNEFFGRVKENNLFGQNPPNRYMHFCAYGYVLTKKGAEKILDVILAKGGIWTSADHLICNLPSILNIYFLHPLLAGCFQDDDPKYKESSFNDFSRLDSFDSDLWNNNEHFSAEDLAPFICEEQPLSINGALRSLTEPEEPIRFVSCMPIDSSKLYEFSWLKKIFKGIPMTIELVESEPSFTPIVVLQRPFIEKTFNLIKGWKKFFILHLSDEAGLDSLEAYELPGCKGVIRNYVRSCGKALTIPLGYHWCIPNGEPKIHTPSPPFRELLWSFVGTSWASRREKLSYLTGEHKLVFMDEWNSPKMIGREENLSLLLNSWFVPCPGGNNTETFRVYEALEAGAIPILVSDSEDPFIKYISGLLPLMIPKTWAHANELMHTMKAQPELYEKYRDGLLAAWECVKDDIIGKVKTMLTA